MVCIAFYKEKSTDHKQP